MQGAKTWYGEVNQNGGYDILARVTSRYGTGVQANVWEGNCLQQSDVASITVKVFDLGTNKENPTGVEVTPDPTASAAANILDALSQLGWPVQYDLPGYNFAHTLSGLYSETANHWYRIEYKFTLVNGQVQWLRVIVKAILIQTAP